MEEIIIEGDRANLRRFDKFNSPLNPLINALKHKCWQNTDQYKNQGIKQILPSFIQRNCFHNGSMVRPQFVNYEEY